MVNLTCIETYTARDNTQYGAYIIEPFETGQGITVGNSLRRTLLSDLVGVSITGVRLNNARHIYQGLSGVREDPLEILLNLKEIVFKAVPFSSPLQATERRLRFTAVLNVQGPKVITAGLLLLPKNELTIVNPNQYICTVVDDERFFLELDIETGTGQELVEHKQSDPLTRLGTTLKVDRYFGPIKHVNYKVKLIHDTQGNLRESVFLELVTDGSLTPKRSLLEATKFMLNLFYQLLITPEFLDVSQKWTNYLIWKMKCQFTSMSSSENEKRMRKEKGKNKQNEKQEDTSKPRKKSETKVAPKPKSKPKMKPSSKPESKPKPKLESKSKSEPKLKSGPKPVPKPKSKPKLKPEPLPKPEPKSKLKPKLNPEPSANPKPELKATPKLKAKSKLEPKSKPKMEPSPKPEPKAGSKPVPKPKLKPKLEPTSKLEPSPKPKPKLKPEPKPKLEPKSRSKPKPKLKPKPKSTAKSVLVEMPDASSSSSSSAKASNSRRRSSKKEVTLDSE